MNKLNFKWVLLGGGAVLVMAMTIVLMRAEKATELASSPESSPIVATNLDIDPGSPAEDVLAPNFQLRDQQGQLTTLKEFRGKVVVLGFVDPHCADICPLMSESMVQALNLVGPAAAHVQLLGISANPTATNISDVAEYTRAHHMQGRWRFLTGSTAQLQQVYNHYHVYATMDGDDAEHQPVIMLIGPKGHERSIYFTRMSYEGVAQQAQLLADRISRLLPGHPAVRQAVSLQFIPPLSPTNNAQIPVVGSSGKMVKLGIGHPHLLLFFADWLEEGATLSEKLAVLDNYADKANQKNLPPPVGVNEFSTESRSSGTKESLTALATKLHIPLIEDVKGRLGDGYGVSDLPWFVLTSSSGRILWHHDGWLSSADLEKEVLAALKKN